MSISFFWLLILLGIPQKLTCFKNKTSSNKQYFSMAMLYKASDRLRKKVKFCGSFRDTFLEKLANFAGIFRANFALKQLVKSRRFCGYFRENSLEIDRLIRPAFLTFFKQRSSFALSSTIRSRNEPMANPLTSRLVPSFLQHNLCLVVSFF